jgi:hypothetical protein
VGGRGLGTSQRYIVVFMELTYPGSFGLRVLSILVWPYGLFVYSRRDVDGR